MSDSKLALLRLLHTTDMNRILPLEEITSSFPNGLQSLRELAEEGLIRPHDRERFDFESDFASQSKPGVRLTKAAVDFLFRSQFVL